MAVGMGYRAGMGIFGFSNSLVFLLVLVLHAELISYYKRAAAEAGTRGWRPAMKARNEY
jgi:hypothetical protein